MQFTIFQPVPVHTVNCTLPSQLHPGFACAITATLLGMCTNSWASCCLGCNFASLAAPWHCMCINSCPCAAPWCSIISPFFDLCLTPQHHLYQLARAVQAGWACLPTYIVHNILQFLRLSTGSIRLFALPRLEFFATWPQGVSLCSDAAERLKHR